MARIKYLDQVVLERKPRDTLYRTTCKACGKTWTERFVLVAPITDEKAYVEMHFHDIHECTKPEKIGEKWVRQGENDQGEDAEDYNDDPQ
jgi:hypothetical protein